MNTKFAISLLASGITAVGLAIACGGPAEERASTEANIDACNKPHSAQVDAQQLEGSSEADSRASDDLEPVEPCPSCSCNMTKATRACRALAGCPAGATALGALGNNCSNSDCNTVPVTKCGGNVTCYDTLGVQCGSIPGDQGECL